MTNFKKRVLALRSRNVKHLSSEEIQKRQKEREIRNLIFEVAFYLIYLAMFLAMVFNSRDDRAYLYTENLYDILDKEDAVIMVTTDEQLWNWTRQCLINFLYTTKDWNGRRHNASSKTVSTLTSYRVGPIRVRQHRLGNEFCRPNSKFPPDLRCSPSWSSQSRSWQNFGEGWSKVSRNSTRGARQVKEEPIRSMNISRLSDGKQIQSVLRECSAKGINCRTTGIDIGPTSVLNESSLLQTDRNLSNLSTGGANLKQVSKNMPIKTTKAPGNYLSAWQYHTWADIGGLPISGMLGVYPPGGYVLDIVGSQTEALESLQYLQANSWIDHMTRVVIFENTLYTPNINMFVMITAIFEFPQSEVIMGDITMYPFRLFNYTSNYPVTRLICDWLVYVALIFFGLREFLLIYRERWRYFLKIWNFLEFVNLLTSAATIAFSVGHAIIADQVSKEANKDQGHFYNFQTLAMWDQLFAIMAAFSSFLSTLQVLHLLRFNKRMSILGATMKLSATDLAPFSIVFAIVILAFASFCVLTFGSFLTDYRNVLQTLESLMLVSLGKFDYESLYEVSPILTPVFILLYMTCVIFLLINFLITILMDSFAQVRDDVNKQPNDYELVDYIVGTMTHLLWQYNPFKFFWSLAVFFGIVSHSKPKSERGKSVQSGTNNDLAVATVKPSKKKMLTKVQINFLKSEIGLDLVEDSLDGLENNIDAIYRMMLTFCSGKLNRKSNNWRKAIVELHVPSLIALDASRDQKSVENTSQSFDPSDMTPSPYIGRNISPSLPAVRHKVLLTPARKMELATVEHSLRAYDDTGSNVDDVTAMEDSTNTSCLTNSPAAVVPSYCPSPAPPVTRSYRPPALKRLEPPSLSVEPSATPSYLPSALDRSSVSPAGVVPRLSWSTSSVSPAGSEDNVSFPRDKFLRPATPVVSFPRDKVFSPATPVVSFPRDKVFSPATPVVSFPRDKVFSPATHNLTFSKDKATLSSRTPNASFTRDTILSPITPIGVVPTLETNMKPKRRLLNRAKFYYDDSFELSMFPTEWDRQLPWKHMDKRHAKVDRHFDRLHVDHPTDQLNPIHSRERLESESIP